MTIQQVFKRAQLILLPIFIIAFASVFPTLIVILVEYRDILITFPYALIYPSIFLLTWWVFYYSHAMLKRYAMQSPYKGIIYSLYYHTNMGYVPKMLKTDDFIHSLHNPTHSTEQFLVDNNLEPNIYKKRAHNELPYLQFKQTGLVVDGENIKWDNIDYWTMSLGSEYGKSYLFLLLHEPLNEYYKIKIDYQNLLTTRLDLLILLAHYRYKYGSV